MRILHYQRDMRLTGGGVVRFVLDLCAAIAARGHEVTLAAPDLSDIPEAWKGRTPGLPRALKLPEPDLPLGLWGPRAMREVRSALTAADAVHVHGAWWPTNVQAARAAQGLGVPYVLTPHGMFDDWAMTQKAGKKRVFHTLFGRRMFEHAAVVQVTAQGELNQSRKWFGGARTAVIPPVVDLEAFKVLPGPQEARAAFAPPLAAAPVVLFLSRVHPQKCAEVLIDAVALLKERSVDCNLFIAGPGEDEYLGSLTRRAAERGVGDRTRLLGMVSGRMKASLYQLAQVFAHPSPQESFGLVLAEAMVCGTPAVATRGVDIWPELEAGRAALLTERTPAAFATVLGRLMGDPALRAGLADAARAWVADYLDPSKVAMQYEALYEGIRRR